ncbi:SCO3374 family protein [Streptomyces sp. S.PNR 29]|uniref:SCO3374 family protein n=1 Tax=Streptomyces sp. S.PNR 29 TaxID=2973805 RepID=UPI0025B0DC87|nr:SCO3374 family protein [Streptomyces sp. S.PNR 29]MDN0198014.1 SCO3374 family protein [Streptomyces sp. S.PNR 29]
MVGTPPSVTAIPLPRRPSDPSGPIPYDPFHTRDVPNRRGGQGHRGHRWYRRWYRRWYEEELGWPTAPGSPLRLLVGVRFDVLDVPAEAGHGALRRLRPGSPVAVQGDRMRLLVAAGSAEEVPGLLDWLEWGALALDLTAIGEGALMDAPPPPGPGAACRGSLPLDPRGAEGAAVWLRPPAPGREAEASLPALSALGGGGDAPDLVRLLDTVATQCHRVRLRHACRT